jgi:hypothetical protein
MRRNEMIYNQAFEGGPETSACWVYISCTMAPHPPKKKILRHLDLNSGLVETQIQLLLVFATDSTTHLG